MRAFARLRTKAVTGILEHPGGEVMRNDAAGYFVHDWQDISDQVRQMISQIRRTRRSGTTEIVDGCPQTKIPYESTPTGGGLLRKGNDEQKTGKAAQTTGLACQSSCQGAGA
jgi:hypothetical protein